MTLTCGTCPMHSIRLALITLLLYASTSLSQECGGIFNDTEGVIKSPLYPSNYSNNLNCIYIITGPPGYRITLNFSDFNLEDNYFCSYDFVEVRDGETDTAPVVDTKFCGSTLPGPLRSTQNIMRVQFRTDSSVNNKGFLAFYTAGVYKREMILLSLKTKIIQVDIETASYIRIPIDSLQQPAALDYDPTEDRIYWTDLTTTGIHSAFLNGSNDRMIRDLGSMASPEGLAIDRSSQLLIYTDAGMKVIGMMTLSGSVHKFLFDTVLDEPRAIVLDTRNGVLFWTDVGRISKIERANYDASNRTTIVSTGLGFPNALAIDLDNNRLYWVDGWTKKIEWSNLDGKNRTEIYQLGAANFVGLALNNNQLYFTDWREDVTVGYKSFLRHINTNGSNIVKMFSSYNRMDDVHVYSQASDKQEINGCGLNNGGCQYICIPLPNNRSKCACPDRQEWDDTQRACTEGQNPCNSSNGGCSDFCSPLAGNRVLCSCPIGSFLLSDQKSCSPNAACSRNLTQLQDSLQSPLYPKNYSDNADCVYIIQQPAKYRITLTFQQFSLQGGYNCLFDFLEIRDGDSATSPLLHVRFCGKELPPPQRTTQNSMWIRFKSDSKISSLGFSASYKASILPKEFILTTFEDHIVRMDIETLSYIKIQIDNVTRPMAVDYDPVGDRIYWSDVSRREVRSSFLSGSDSTLLRALGPDALPNGIAVDSYSRLLIYSDAGQKVIAMMSISAKGSEYSHRIVFNTNLSEPHAIVLDTTNGTIFWTDIGTVPKIERGNYDGSDRRTLIRFSLRQPNALAIDFKNNLLYWVDAGTDHVEVANLDGLSRRSLWSSAGSHFYGLSLYNNELYITNWKIFSNQVYESSIHVLNTNGTEITDLIAAEGQLGDIHIYSDRAEDLGSNACVNTNSGCSDMCIPLPQNTSKCLCPDLFHLSENGKTCISNVTTTTTHQPSSLVTLISTYEQPSPSTTFTPATEQPSPSTTFTPATEQPSPSTTFTPATERPSSVAMFYVIMCADTTSNFTLVCEAGDFRVTKYKWNVTCAEGESVQTCTLEPKLFVDGGNAVMCTMENAEGKEFLKVFKFDSSDPSSNFVVVCDAGDFRVTKYKWNVTCAERESVQTCTLEHKPFIDSGKAVMCSMENAKGEEISRVFKFDPSCTKSEQSQQRGSSGVAKAVGIAVPVTIIIVVIVVIVIIVLGRKKGFIFWNRPKLLVDEDSVSFSNLADRTGRESIRHDKCEQVNPGESGVMQPVYGNTTEDIPANQSTNKEDIYMTLQL